MNFKLNSKHNYTQDGDTMKLLYVKVDQHKEAKEVIALIETKIGEARQTLDRIHQLRQQEDQELDRWAAEIGGAGERVAAVKKALSETCE